LGYDYSINYCPNGTVDASGTCRTDPKPIRWDYYNNANRQALYNVYSKLLQLRNTTNYFSTFTTGNISYNLSGAFKSLTVTSDSLKIVVLGNFDVTAQTGTVTFPYAGFWFSYLDNKYHLGTGNSESITLQPGEFYVYLNKNLNGTVVPGVPDTSTNNVSGMTVKIYPNPIQQSSVAEFNLPESGNTDIVVYDLTGNILSVIYSGSKPKGKQTIAIPKSIFPSYGIYFLKIEQNGKKSITKFLVVK
jgi:hypothetical protein